MHSGNPAFWAAVSFGVLGILSLVQAFRAASDGVSSRRLRSVSGKLVGALGAFALVVALWPGGAYHLSGALGLGGAALLIASQSLLREERTRDPNARWSRPRVAWIAALWLGLFVLPLVYMLVFA